MSARGVSLPRHSNISVAALMAVEPFHEDYHTHLAANELQQIAEWPGSHSARTVTLGSNSLMPATQTLQTYDV